MHFSMICLWDPLCQWRLVLGWGGLHYCFFKNNSIFLYNSLLLDSYDLATPWNSYKFPWDHAGYAAKDRTNSLLSDCRSTGYVACSYNARSLCRFKPSREKMTVVVGKKKSLKDACADNFTKAVLLTKVEHLKSFKQCN